MALIKPGSGDIYGYSRRHKVSVDDVTRLASALPTHARCGCGSWWGMASLLRTCDLCGQTARRIG